jgi:ComF family protein
MSIFKHFISLFYPDLCASCGNSLNTDEEILCLECMYSLPETNFHLYEGNSLEKLFWGKMFIESAVSYYYYSKKGKVQNMIHQLKYHGHKEIGVYLGKQYGKILLSSSKYNIPDLIIPVPLHRDKQRKRGYNQSEYFAKGLSDSINIPYYTDILFRSVPSKSQTYQKRYERWKNVMDIFDINNSELINGKHILLVDDVITTGSTIEASAKPLLSVPGIKLSIASIAFAGI